MDLLFNSVVVTKNGARRTLSVDAFLAMPLHERVGCVLAQAVEFYRDEMLVERKLALASLRNRMAGT